MELTEEVKALLLNTAKERKRQRTAGVHGADGASLGSRWEASGRTGVGLESWDDVQRDATRWNAGWCVWMPFHHGAASGAKTICPTCSTISPP